MKQSTLILYIFVWSISLVSAFYFGTQTIETSKNTAAYTKNNTLGVDLSKIESKANSDKNTESDSAIQSYLNGETTAIEEAVREISTLTNEMSSRLLDEAFALPKSDPNRRRVIRELLSQLAENEPVTALELASQIDSLQESERARMSILRVWGRNDPAAALKWASKALENEPARTRSSQISAIYRGYARNNPESAFQQVINTDEDERLRNRLLGDIIETQVAFGGLMAAKLKVELISDQQLQNDLRRELVDEWARFDPEAAADYVLSLGESAETNIKSTLVREWAESDPEAAAAWLSKLPEDDPAIARASAEIIQEWTRYDLTASAKWLNNLPPSPELDRAVISYTFRAAEEDPSMAMTWAQSVDNDNRRSWIMERVASRWKEEDPDGFRNYLNSSGFNEEQRARLENAQSRGSWGPRR